MNLPILAINHLIAALRMMHSGGTFSGEVVTGRCRLGARLVVLLICSSAADTLSPSTEESFHAIYIVSVLRRLLLGLIVIILLRAVHFLMAAARLVLLHLSAIVSTESGLGTALSIRLDRLHLALESLVDALPLWHGMAHILWTRDLRHSGQIWAQRHALMHMAG